MFSHEAQLGKWIAHSHVAHEVVWSPVLQCDRGLLGDLYLYFKFTPQVGHNRRPLWNPTALLMPQPDVQLNGRVTEGTKGIIIAALT